MHPTFERCAGLDVHQATVMATVRIPDDHGGRQAITETFGTTTNALMTLRDWLQAHGVTQVAMESTGVYWKPVYYVLEDAFTLLLVNVQQLKQVPGRKSDVRDSAWIAQLLEWGLLRGSLVLPAPMRDLRELTRYRKHQIRDRAREVNRLHRVLEDAGIKLSTVATDVMGVSGRAMINALVHGTTDPAVLADLAQGKLRKKLPALQQALAGRFRPHHGFLIAQILAKVDFLEETIGTLTAEIDRLVAPFEATLANLDTIPGVNRKAAITIIATVALGLGLVTAVFTIYNTILFRVDAVRDPGELFAVEQRMALSTERVPLTRSDYEAMRRETSVFTDAAAVLSGADVATMTRIDSRPAVGVLVSGNFFRVLGVRSTLGRPLTPEDDEPFNGRPVIVLSYAAWRTRFDADQGVIGRRVVINETSVEIVGVMPDGFRGLGLTTPAYWAPLAIAGQVRDVFAGREETMPIEIVGRLKREMSPEAGAAALRGWASARTGSKAADGRVTIALTPRQGTLPAPALKALMAFAPLFFAFGLILLIGCANVANLLLARSLSRQREIGVRLSLGASRVRIIRQLLTESLLLSCAAAACALAVSRVILEGALAAAITLPPPEIVQLVGMMNLTVPSPDWRVLLFVAAAATISAVFFGLAPALQATRLDLVRTMRGEVTKDARPGRARHALISLQVGASALLLVCAVIFLRGSLTAATKPPGIRTSDTVRVSVANEPRRAALLQAMSADPSIAAVAASSQPMEVEIQADTSSRASVLQLAVSSEYFDVLGIDVVRGRGFTLAERTADAGVVVVAETVARRLWPNGDSVGRQMHIESRQPASQDGRWLPPRTMTVIGVARDPLRESGMSYLETFRGVYTPASPETPRTWLMLRVRGNPDAARQALLDRLTRVDPAISNIITLRSVTELQTYVLRIGFWLTVLLGGLGLVLTVSGLFSVLSYLVEQQAKDIGVRMALGAARKHVVQLVLAQSLRPVGIGLIAGAGLAAALAIVLLTMPGAAEIGDWVHVLDPVAYGTSALTIVMSSALAVSVPALRAARIDPIATLRKD